jgi:dUTP pyrophosphatase
MTIQFLKLLPGASIPLQQREGDAGYDLKTLHGGIVRPEPQPYHTGIAVKIPAGHVGLICPRSGLAARGVTVTNAPGIIDSNYTGELIVLLNSVTADRFVNIAPGDRIAQLVVVPLCAQGSTEVDGPFDETNRGAAGFGSSGR